MEDHSSIVLAHEERFKNIDSRLNNHDKHVEESVDVRRKVDEHEIKLQGIEDIRKDLGRYALGIIVTLILGILWLGGRFATLERLEKLHPITTEQNAISPVLQR